ncbi:exodeoxyribonuclease V subunit beta [Thermodesulfobacteriota bacterium]
MPETSSKPATPITFNLTRSPLKGLNLIDASAGTGKTYTICGLVLRLLLEKDLNIEQILVVTYTEAATEDLRDRIRQKLRQALEALNKGTCDDSFLQEYLGRISDTVDAEKRFSDALRSFDEAAIFTIHSFCHRMLLENSFESNTLFDTELVADDSHLIHEIIEDFWRCNFYNCSDLFTEYVSDTLTPQALLNFLKTFLPRPSLKFIPAVEPEAVFGNLSTIEAEYNKAFRAVCTAWESARDEVSYDMLESKALNRNIFRKKKIPELLSALEDMAATCRPSLHLFDKFILFTESKMLAGTKSTETPNILPFYEICETLVQVHSTLLKQYDQCLLALKKKLADSFHHELELRKKKDNIFSFDDLLRRLHRAFSGPGGIPFARAVAQKYPAILIDEFQDTDPLQFEIFSTLHKQQSLLFLIGDPKQAIYSFRGADIFTYMDAAASRPLFHYTLDVNHRSEPGLVKAVNTLFSRSKSPFVFDAISFQPVSPAQKPEPEWLIVDGEQEEPFIVWHLDMLPPDKETACSKDKKRAQLTKTNSRRIITTAVTSEITRLLALAAENRATINEKRLQPGDIAILVRTNNEARKMQQALAACRIPSVLHSGDNLFASEEAEEMALLLKAVAAANDIRKVKAALLTRLIGLQANDIELSGPATEKVIEHWLTRFKTYHGLWNRDGFIQMFWTIMAENNIRSRMLGFENGERILTNILHLAEILHLEASEQGLNMTALLGYLQERLTGEQAKTTEHPLRLESDDDRVKIVTMHKAKGLEYPVVFCPFTWEGSRLKPGKWCIFHRRGKDRTELIFDGGSPELETHMQLAMHEEMAENLRLLYVAVTRAIHRCYLVWGPIRGSETSGPAYLLHQGPSESRNTNAADGSDYRLIRKTADRFLKLSGNEFLGDLKELAAESCGTIKLSAISEIPTACSFKDEEESVSLRPRNFTATINADWKISSYSHLAAHTSAAEKIDVPVDEVIPGQDEFPGLVDRIEEQEDRTSGPVEYDIFSFPHGAGPGIMLHEVLEKVDFRAVNHPATQTFIQQKLLNFGYDKAWQPIIADMLDNLNSLVLHRGIPGLTLANIPPKNCLHELEFYFPLSRITPGSLKNIFTGKTFKNGGIVGPRLEQQMDRLNFSPARGFMKGFIDLVFEFQGKFFLADWKSNYLGSHIRDYHHDRLLEAIYGGFYFLQYHLYSLALHLYLKNRLPEYSYETHFGGVFYVFLRGVRENLGPDYGIFFDRPDPTMMESLTETLVAGKSPQSPKEFSL